MKKAPAKVIVKVWQLPGILLEEYAYTAGSVEPLPKTFSPRISARH